jgi:CopC domain
LAPAAVVLQFSENLSPALSEATVSSTSERSVIARPITAREISANLVTSTPGLYVVRWMAVSVDDGHTTQRTITFTVEARASAAQASGSSAAPSVTDIGIALARWVEDSALLLAIGMLFLRWLAAGDDELVSVRPRLPPPVVVALVAGCIVVGTECKR